MEAFSRLDIFAAGVYAYPAYCTDRSVTEGESGRADALSGEKRIVKPLPERRKILIVEDEPSIRNILYALLAGQGCDSEIAYSGKEALAMIGRERFDAVLLDLRVANLPAQQVVSQIIEIRPSLVGRVLVITGEVSDAQTLEWIARDGVLHLAANRIMQELWGRLRSILGLAPSP